ncbi:unnamed protein product [Haemonchus placei]|uniref:EB domain-containing protein n=1 Tax=Haemonchus placei TaxID=6290 RepID=A0A0N4W2J3_HAEPC|nr:unnamed protein product [Haemonchus placei]
MSYSREHRFILAGNLRNHFYRELHCVNHFCPPGSFCSERKGPCKTPPCRPILLCIPDQYNGCAGHSCPSGEICVERVQPCIGKSCKKIPSCATDLFPICETKNGVTNQDRN